MPAMARKNTSTGSSKVAPKAISAWVTKSMYSPIITVGSICSEKDSLFSEPLNCSKYWNATGKATRQPK